MRTRRFYSDAELVGFFKAHVLSFVEYRTAGLYHAASSTLVQVDRVLSSFLSQIGLTDVEALLNFQLAPLATRRNMAMLAVIHRTLLQQGPPFLSICFCSLH